MNAKTNTRAERILTRRDLRDEVYRSCPKLSRAEARRFFDETIDELCEALLRGEDIKLRGFGMFKVRAKRERIGRNPKTGVEAIITPRRVVTFVPSPVLVARVNGEEPSRPPTGRIACRHWRHESAMPHQIPSTQ